VYPIYLFIDKNVVFDNPFFRKDRFITAYFPPRQDINKPGIVSLPELRKKVWQKRKIKRAQPTDTSLPEHLLSIHWPISFPGSREVSLTLIFLDSRPAPQKVLP
jgi:hypothetical protein